MSTRRPLRDPGGATIGYESVAPADESAAGAPQLDAGKASPLDVGITDSDGEAQFEFANVEMDDPGGRGRDHA